MITEDYVSFETAKLLKEKGFDGMCSRMYLNNEMVHFPVVFSYGDKTVCFAPTLQMVMKWLRVEHNLEIYPYHNNPETCNSKWWFEIIEYPNTVAEYESGMDEEFDTYEEACEFAIKYCLENLI